MPETTTAANPGPTPGRVSPARVVAAAARGAFADLRTIYTPFTWTVGWLGRIIMQVLFFALIGALLGNREAIVYLFVGQAVMATVTEVFMAIPSTTWERPAGTLALLVASSGPLWPVFVGRSLPWLSPWPRSCSAGRAGARRGVVCGGRARLHLGRGGRPAGRDDRLRGVAVDGAACAGDIYKPLKYLKISKRAMLWSSCD